jgi:ribonuclease HI
MNKTANIRYADRNMFIKTSYDAAFVAELKSTVKARKWNPESKEWAIDIRERVIALELVKRYYEVVEDNEIQEIPQIPKLLEMETGKALNQTGVVAALLSGGNLEIWTDGACIGNPGPGGFGIIFKYNGQTQAKSGGFSLTTNNRMEIMAAIVALETLKEKAKVVIYSDSQYLVNAMMKGWAKKWKANNWMRTRKDKAINPDLWDRLLQLCDLHEVEFRWVRGHNSQTENEWCDQLAEAAAHQPDLPVDVGYKSENGLSYTDPSLPISENKLL